MKKFNSIGLKIIMSIVLLTLIISTVLICIGYFTYKKTMDEHYETLGIHVAETAISMLDIETVQRYVDQMGSGNPNQIMAEPEYQQSIQILRKIRTSNDVMYLYMVLFDETGAYYVFDSDETESCCEFGFLMPYYDGPFGAFSDDLVAGRKVPAIISNEDYGWIITVFHPFPNNSGEPLGYMAVDISMDGVAKERQDYLLNCVLLMSVVTAIFAAVYAALFNKIYVQPIRDMTAATSDFVAAREGNNAAVSHISELRVNTGDELQTLCDSLKKMDVDLHDHIENLRNVTAEKERIGAELDVATRIQASMLPCIFPAFPERKEFEVYATMNPAKEVGGDFYDFFMVDEDNLAIVVADVSGKGIPAALFMVIGKTLIKDHTAPGKDLGAVFSEVNQILCQSNSEELFITAFEGVLNLKTGEFRFVNAGHEIPFICKKNDAFHPYKIRAGFVLAGMECIRYRAGSLQLEPGDKLFQYTDGVTEATDANNRLYGMERLEQTLGKLSDEDPVGILTGLKADIDRFVGDAPQFDDITMLCIAYHGTAEKSVAAEVSLDEMPGLTQFLENALEEFGAPMSTVVKMNIALDEIFSNIVKFSGASYAKISCGQEEGGVFLRFEDNGIAYDPLKKEDADITLSAEDREIGGLGLLMVKKSMDAMEYAYENSKNILTLHKKI